MLLLATNPGSASQRRGRRDCESREKWIETERSLRDRHSGQGEESLPGPTTWMIGGTWASYSAKQKHSLLV
jgi:hypothetical protein